MKEFFSLFFQTLFSLLVIIAAPFIGIVLLIWWIVAGILGVFFSKVQIFPIGKMYRSASRWMMKNTGEELSSYKVIFSIFLMFYKGYRRIFR